MASEAHRTLFEAAQRYLPGGVSASARFNPAIGRPFFVARGEGPYVFDLDGRRYIDMCMSHGASLLDAARCALDALSETEPSAESQTASALDEPMVRPAGNLKKSRTVR